MSRVVVAASTGTVFEYYDFLLYGSLATFFGALFFPPGNETAALLASLATFGAGFAIRPLGALIFGRLGDRVGRKKTFLITIVLMGLSTALVGVLPDFETIGWWAPRCSSRCDSFKVLRSVVNMAELRSTSPNTVVAIDAASSRVGFKRRPPSDSCSLCS